jgi:hypothetical protein
MPFYANFTTVRATQPDVATLVAALKTALGDATAVLVPLDGIGLWRGKKNATDWSGADITAAQNLLDTTVATTPEIAAQRMIDTMPIETKALLLALIDQLNVIRAALPAPLGAITPAQAIAAVRAKAGTL